MTDPIRCFDPAHRSYSADRLWDECQYLAHAEDAGTVTRSFPMKVARGSAVDEVVMAMIVDQDPPDVEASLRRYAAEYGSGTPSDRDIEAAVAQVALFEREVLPKLPPVWAVQHEGHFDVEGISYHYHADIVYEDGSIDDVKAPDQRLGDRRADSDVQLTAYAYGLWKEFGELPPRVGLIGLVNANPPPDVRAWNAEAVKPWLDRQTSTRTLDQLYGWASVARAREAARRFAESTGVYQMQGRSSPYACNGCVAKQLCPSWHGWRLAEDTAA